MNVYRRTVNGHREDGGQATTATEREALNEISDHTKLLRVSGINSTDYHLVYRNGDVVTLTLIDTREESPKKESMMERDHVHTIWNNGIETSFPVRVPLFPSDYPKAIKDDEPIDGGDPEHCWDRVRGVWKAEHYFLGDFDRCVRCLFTRNELGCE